MKYFRLGQLVGVAALAVALNFPKHALGDAGRTSTRTRLPATVAEVNRFIESAKGLRTLDDVRKISGTVPECVAPLIYRWRLADGVLDTVTMRTKEGEFITCWGRVR
jgi:hypothetical protein